MSAGATRTAPAQLPDGWWLGHARYRRYVLFAATGGMLWLAALIVLGGINALGRGAAAWDAYLASLASPIGVVVMTLIVISILFFAFRWLRVGVKIPLVDIGPIAAPPEPVIWVVHFGGLAALTAVLLLILSGVIL
jgi:fumarate reductase subunit C